MSSTRRLYLFKYRSLVIILYCIFYLTVYFRISCTQIQGIHLKNHHLFGSLLNCWYTQSLPHRIQLINICWINIKEGINDTHFAIMMLYLLLKKHCGIIGMFMSVAAPRGTFLFYEVFCEQQVHSFSTVDWLNCV